MDFSITALIRKWFWFALWGLVRLHSRSGWVNEASGDVLNAVCVWLVEPCRARRSGVRRGQDADGIGQRGATVHPCPAPPGAARNLRGTSSGNDGIASLHSKCLSNPW